jgi:hypothetical protein
LWLCSKKWALNQILHHEFHLDRTLLISNNNKTMNYSHGGYENDKQMRVTYQEISDFFLSVPFYSLSLCFRVHVIKCVRKLVSSIEPRWVQQKRERRNFWFSVFFLVLHWFLLHSWLKHNTQATAVKKLFNQIFIISLLNFRDEMKMYANSFNWLSHVSLFTTQLFSTIHSRFW